MTYKVAQVCLNGHLVTGDVYSEDASKFCSKCGERAISLCPDCNQPLRGDWDGFVVMGASVSAFCYNCGKAYPWTLRQVETAKELAAEVEGIDKLDLEKAQDSFIALTSDTPQTAVAAARVSKLLKRAGPVVGNAIKEIVTSIATDAAKKMIGL